MKKVQSSHLEKMLEQVFGQEFFTY